MSKDVRIKKRIIQVLKIIFWLVILTGFSLSIWYATLIVKDKADLDKLEESFIKGWSIAQTFMTCATLPLGLLKLYSSINSLRLNGIAKNRLQKQIYNKRRDQITMIINSRRNPTELYLKENKIKTVEDRISLLSFACQFTKKLEGTVISDLVSVFKNNKKVNKDVLNQVKEIISRYNIDTLDCENFKTALKAL